MDNKNELSIKSLELNGNLRAEVNQETLNELVASIKSQGILQPILVRVHPKTAGKFQVIAGQRRFLAAQKAGLETVPVIIKQITDEQIPEIQIVENLQRSDVHPMEEAIAFKALSLQKKETAEISRLVGKNGNYVANRLKLNDLAPEYQKGFRENKITLGTCLKICKLSAENQKKLWNRAHYSVNDYQVKEYIGDLNDAPFDTTDATLNPKRGACTGCPLNSSNNNLLFPDPNDKGKCMDTDCFQLKTKVGYKKGLDAAIADPTIALASLDMGADAIKLKKQGDKVLHVTEYGNSHDARLIDAPDPEHYEVDRDDYDTEKDYQTELKKEAARMEKDKAEYEKKAQSGKFQKVFIVEGSNAGKTRLVELNKQSATKDAKKNMESGKASDADVRALISGIRDREKRALELDYEKVITKLSSDIPKHMKTPHSKTLTADEEAGMIALLYQKVKNYSPGRALIAGIKLSDGPEKLGSFKKLNAAQRAQIIRAAMYQEYHATTSHRWIGSKTIRAMAEGIGVDVKTVDKDQAEIAKARAERVKERITQLSVKTKKPAKKK